MTYNLLRVQKIKTKKSLNSSMLLFFCIIDMFEILFVVKIKSDIIDSDVFIRMKLRRSVMKIELVFSCFILKILKISNCLSYNHLIFIQS